MFYYIINYSIGDYAYISLAQFTKLLGKEAESLSAEEIERIYDQQYGFAKLAFNKWSKERGLVAKIATKNEYKIAFCYTMNNKTKVI